MNKEIQHKGTNIQVSVIVASYNPSYEKMIKTLLSIVVQKKILFEIIIADDGSKEDVTGNIRKFFEKVRFDEYQIVKNEKNVGTVRNILSGIKKAKGRYVYITSPGDLLFDENVLKSFFDFSEKRGAKIVFGDGIYYEAKNEDEIFIHRVVNHPDKPGIFNENMPTFLGEVELLSGTKILGAAFFRDRIYMEELLEEIKDTSIYVEDTTTTILGVVKGERVWHYPRNMIWYEYGGGISTSANIEWQKRLDLDVRKTMDYICAMYEDEAKVDYMKIMQGTTKKNKIIKCLKKHPLKILAHMMCKLLKKNTTQNADTDFILNIFMDTKRTIHELNSVG